MRPADVQLAYYEAEHPYLEGTGRKARTNLIVSAIAPLLKDRKKILEVGAGYGRFTQNLTERGFDVTPSDVSPAMLERLRGKSARKPLRADLGNSLARLAQRYNAIVGFHILHHLPEARAAFEFCYQNLNAGGGIIFVEPNFRNILYYIQLMITPQLKWRAEKGVLNMRRQLLEKQISAAGFSDIRFFRFGYLPDFLIERSYGARLENFITRHNKSGFGSLYLCMTATKK